MPDLSQEEQTCLPTSTANVIIWFANHGYPKLLQSGDTEDDRDLHTVHVIMTDTDARYDFGTSMFAITSGIKKYINDSGYDADVEYRGMDWGQAKFTQIVKDDAYSKYMATAKPPQPFTQEWLKENDDPNKCFILLLAYVKFNPATNTFTNAFDAGHAVTLVNAEPDMLLIHDPAHEQDETGRKILTPQVLTGGTFELPGLTVPVSGLLLLSGDLLEAPPDAAVMLTGAVCITMHPQPSITNLASTTTTSPVPTLGGAPVNNTSPTTPMAPTKPVAPASQNTSWGEWLFDLVFKK